MPGNVVPFGPVNLEFQLTPGTEARAEEPARGPGPRRQGVVAVPHPVRRGVRRPLGCYLAAAHQARRRHPAEGASPKCAVRADGKLWCGDRVGAKGHVDRSYGSAVRGALYTLLSWFAYWGYGVIRTGRKGVWYGTEADNGQ